MNNNLKLDINLDTLKKLTPLLAKAQVYIYGVAVIAVFAYTAYVINQALNVQPAQSQSVIQPVPKITFNKSTMDQLKSLSGVQGSVSLGSLGESNPF